MGKQEIVHFPKLTLRACCFGGLGGLLGMGVNSRERVMPEDQTQLVAQLRAQIAKGDE
jgi:hypothetical protein